MRMQPRNPPLWPWTRALSGALDFDGLRAIAVVHALSADFDVQIMQTRIFKQARRLTLALRPTRAWKRQSRDLQAGERAQRRDGTPTAAAFCPRVVHVACAHIQHEHGVLTRVSPCAADG